MSLVLHLSWIPNDSLSIVFLFNDLEAILPLMKLFSKFLYITSKFITLYVIEPVFP